MVTEAGPGSHGSGVISDQGIQSAKTKNNKWTSKTFKNMRNWQNSDTDSQTAGGGQDGIKLKRQLTRGSSEKMMLVNRFKKCSEQSQSPDRGNWRPKLSLRRKSMPMDESIFKE